MDRFTFTVSEGDTPLVVHLEGELDLASAPGLEEALTDIDGPVVFDCAKLTFIDSSGIKVFVHVHKHQGLSVRHAAPMVRQVLEIMGLDELCEESTP
jgi:anti-anti-sigma factor